MAQAQGFGRRYVKAFFKGFFVAVPVTVTFLDRVACVARVEGASMQPSLNPGGRQASDVVLLNHWSIRNYDVQRGDIVSLVPRRTGHIDQIDNPYQLRGKVVDRTELHESWANLKNIWQVFMASMLYTCKEI
uniref:Mitochondrial inner membrane protease subunit n=1 Tax=Meleagris gallopavo TaxID=9103 RepID=A0A803Y0V6_MELGA